MNSRVLAAGWPFAGLLALDAGRADVVPDVAQLRGLVLDNDGGPNDGRSGVLVLELDETAGPFAINAATRFFGVDGYPIPRGDIHVGDLVETVQEKRGPEWVTTQVHVLGRRPGIGHGAR